MPRQPLYRLLPTLALLLVLTSTAAPAQAQGERCFAETGRCISGRFLEFWEQNGGLAVFGLPITEASSQPAADGQEYLTQWFERNRFEWHPGNAAPYDVLLSRLGDEALQRQGIDWQTQGGEGGPQEGCLWFEQTGHNVCNQSEGLGFRSTWESNGLQDPALDAYGRSLALFGLPISAATEQVNPADGQTYLTQWFERARFEWHPQNPDAYKVQLGLLGREMQAALTNGQYNEGMWVGRVAQGDLMRFVVEGNGVNEMQIVYNCPSPSRARYFENPDGPLATIVNGVWTFTTASGETISGRFDTPTAASGTLRVTSEDCNIETTWTATPW